MAKPKEQTTSVTVLLTGIVSGLLAAINTHRTSTADIAKQKREADSKIQELSDKLDEICDDEDSDAGDTLRSGLEELLTAAQAAKPPTDEQIAEVEAIEAEETKAEAPPKEGDEQK